MPKATLYPCWRYHAAEGGRIIQSARDEHGDWRPEPYPAPPVVATPVVDPLTAKFNEIDARLDALESRKKK